MAELRALDKFPCPACGAQATWNAAKQLLVCPFCGTSVPFDAAAATSAIEELDLVKALTALPDEARGWQTATRTVQCQSCQAVSVFDAARVGQNCDFCGSPALVDYTEIQAPIRPRSVLAFKVPEAQVREQIRKWYASKWLAPNRLTTRAMVDRVHGVYIPYWTFDSHVVCPWDAQAGHYYYTTESYRDSNGRSQSRQKRHVRWEPASGVVTHFFDDEPIPGTKGVSAALLQQAEPFLMSDLVPYDKAFLSGFVVEHYQIDLKDAARRSQEAMTDKVRDLCAAAVPGDTHQNLRIRPTWSGQTFKHILVPVWLLTYNYGAKPYQVVVNGSTGRIAGDYPKSPWKVAALVAAVLIFILILMLVAQE